MWRLWFQGKYLHLKQAVCEKISLLSKKLYMQVRKNIKMLYNRT